MEDHDFDDELLRRIGGLLDLSDVRRETRSFYSAIGRPSVEPEPMIRMSIIGYRFAIRSERRPCEKVQLSPNIRCHEEQMLNDRPQPTKSEKSARS